MSRFSEEEYPSTIKDIFQPLFSRLFLLSKKNISLFDVENDYKQDIQIIEGSIFRFDNSDSLIQLKKALSDVNLILTEGLASIEIEIPDDLPWDENAIPGQKEILKKEIDYYKEALTKMVAFMNSGDDQSLKRVEVKGKKASLKIEGVSIFLSEGSELDKTRRISRFCDALEESKLIDKMDFKLIHKAFSGQKMAKKINWIGPKNELAFLFECLSGDDGTRYLKREVVNKIWIRVSECFTCKGEEINADNIKSNKYPKDSTRRQKIEEIVETLD